MEYQIIESSPGAIAHVKDNPQKFAPDLESLPVGMSLCIPADSVLSFGAVHLCAYHASTGQRRYLALNHGNVYELARLPDWTPTHRPGSDLQAVPNVKNENAKIETPAIESNVPIVNENTIEKMHAKANGTSVDDETSYSQAQFAAVLKACRDYYNNDFAFVSKVKCNEVSAQMHQHHVIPIDYILKKVRTLAPFKKCDNAADIIIECLNVMGTQNRLEELEGEAKDFYNVDTDIFGLYPSIKE